MYVEMQGGSLMVDLAKIIKGKSLTETEEKVLLYVVEHMDTVLEKGVRQIARENYTSPSSIMRLAKKLGYSGFIDMYYQLVPMVVGEDRRKSKEHEGADNGMLKEILLLNEKKYMDAFAGLLKSIKEKYIFIYATGFSGIIGEYLYKKLLVNGKRVIFATGNDSIAILESNVDHIGMLITVTKSGETQQVLDKMEYCKEKGIPVVVFTSELDNRASRIADIPLKVEDSKKLDDRNISKNYFFAELLLLFEYLVSISM